MTVQAILAPLFAQVLLTFALLLWMGRSRLTAVRSGVVKGADVTLGQRNWPARAQQAANAFSNQFELPVLFYILTALALVTRKADLVFVVLAWVFVVSRIVHAGVYIITNHVPHRFTAYVVGALVLMLLWIVFAVRILIAPLGL